MCLPKYQNDYVLINDNRNNCNHSQSNIAETVERKNENMFIVLLMIQHNKYDNETTDDMIKNETKKYKKSSYEETREIVLEKEKSNNPVEEKFKKTK